MKINPYNTFLANPEGNITLGGDTGVSDNIIFKLISKNSLWVGGLCSFDSRQNIVARPCDPGNVSSGFTRVDTFVHQQRDCQR
jgi:hypothetical protein